MEKAHTAGRLHPGARSTPLTQRILRWWLALWALVIAFSIGAVVLASHGSPVQIAAGIAFGMMFVLHFAVVLASAALQIHARRLLDRAEASGDPAFAERALRIGMRERSMMRAWLFVAQAAVADRASRMRTSRLPTRTRRAAG